MSDSATVQMPVPSSPGGVDDARGVTEIQPRVVEKIAARVAAEVDGVAGTVSVGGGLRRLVPGLGAQAPADASAQVAAHSASVSLVLNVRYPYAVLDVTDRVRDRVVTRLQQWTGLEVTDLDITVAELATGTDRQRRVE